MQVTEKPIQVTYRKVNFVLIMQEPAVQVRPLLPDKQKRA